MARLAIVTVPQGFLKGQLHAHTSVSDDSSTSPHDVHRWYEAHGYDFVVFTDHNSITDTSDTVMLTIPGVELTRTLRTCEPPPPRDMSCLLHMNVLFANAPTSSSSSSSSSLSTDSDTRAQRIDFLGEESGVHGELSTSRRDVYRHELKRANELGGIAMLNHPNMEYAADEALVLDLSERGLTLLEIGNQAWDSNNAGDAAHPSTEAIWDGVLTRGAHIFGTATDDAHHYADADAIRRRGERPFTGDLGFVVVRAEKSIPMIRSAISRGDFYASTGVVFESYNVGSDTISLATQGGVTVLFEVISRGGVVMRSERAARLDVRLRAEDGPYIRVRAKRDDGAFAWTQPIFSRLNPAPSTSH